MNHSHNIKDIILLGDIVKRNLIDLRYDAADYLNKFVDLPPTVIVTEHPHIIEGYFRLQLAKSGYSSAINKLKSIECDIPIEIFASVGSMLSQSIGNYDEQFKYLCAISHLNKGWIQRELVKCMINREQLSEALDKVITLLNISPDFYYDFCHSILWEMNCWELMAEYTIKNKDHVSIPYVDYAIDAINNNKINTTCDLKIYSIYNQLTTNQLHIQESLARKSGYKILPSQGALPDRFPRSILELMGGPNYQLGVVGATIAHLKTIEDFIATNDDYCAITESDTFFTTIFNLNIYIETLRSNKIDFLLCSDRHTKLITPTISTKIQPYIFRGRASGFDGYILSRTTALRILERFAHPPYKDHIDGEVIRWLCEDSLLKISKTSQPIFAQSLLSLFSTRSAIELKY